MTGSKQQKTALVVHKGAGPSLRCTRMPPIVQQKHIGFGLKQHGVHISTGYMATLSKPTLPTVPEELAPTNWMDANSEKVLWDSIMMSQDDSSLPRTSELQDDDFNTTIPHETYLEEMMSHEGRGDDPPDQCPDCCNEQAVYQCQTCFGQDFCCHACIMHRHVLLPFHRVRVSLNL